MLPAKPSDRTVSHFPMNPGKLLMIFGALLFAMGALWKMGSRAGLGNLPGDLSMRRGNTSFYFPVVTCLLLSVALTVVFNLVLRFFR